jgi:transposase InsO family protein
MCRVFEVSRSGFYAYLKRKPGAKQQEDQRLKTIIKTKFVEHKRVYGPVRISKILQKLGNNIGRVRSKRLMHECDLVRVAHRPYKRTTIPDKSQYAAPDLVQRNFTAEAPDKL